MSEALRSYSQGGKLRNRRRVLHNRGRNLTRIVLPVLVVLTIAALWITRDNQPIAGFIPENLTVELYIANLIDRRADITHSRVWELLPEDSAARHVLDSWAGDPPLPEWLFNNLVSGPCHVSGSGLDRFDDMLLISRMTRVGCLAERAMRLLPAIRRDHAGGLRLYHVPEADIYYAVRGRTLLVTASRDRLIHALTLDGDAKIDTERFRQGVLMAAGADVFCRLSGAAWSDAEPPFAEATLALRVEGDAVRLVARGTLSPDFQRRFNTLLSAAKPVPLPAPVDAVASISADFGMTPPEMMDALVDLLGLDREAAPWDLLLAEGADIHEAIEDIQTLIALALRQGGTKLRLAWFGIDYYEMLPMPLLAATFNADTDAFLALLERIPPPPESIPEFDLAPRLNEELFMAYAPFVGGPSIEPAVAGYAGGIIVSSSGAMAMRMQQLPGLTQHHGQDGNLYVVVKPLAAVESCVAAGRELAASGLLRGHTEASFEAAAVPWLDAGQKVEEIVLLGLHDAGELQIEVKMSMSEVQAPPAQTAE